MTKRWRPAVAKLERCTYLLGFFTGRLYVSAVQRCKIRTWRVYSKGTHGNAHTACSAIFQ